MKLVRKTPVVPDVLVAVLGARGSELLTVKGSVHRHVSPFPNGCSVVETALHPQVKAPPQCSWPGGTWQWRGKESGNQGRERLKQSGGKGRKTGWGQSERRRAWILGDPLPSRLSVYCMWNEL